MKKFCIITPDRKDRKEFLEHCKYQMSQQTLQPNKHYIVDYPATVEENDLLNRLVYGLKQAKQDGFNICFVIENDDYYPNDYLEKMYDAFIKSRKDMIGIGETYLYHLFKESYNVYIHPLRAPLFCTGFKIDKVLPYLIPPILKPLGISIILIDMYLYNISHMQLSRKIIISGLFKFPENSPIGIKHGIGKCSTRAHTKPVNYRPDKQGKQLQYIRKESLDFYNQLKIEYA